MKHFAKAALCGVYKYSGAMYAQEAVARVTGDSFLAVLLFHRVTDVIPEDGLTVGTKYFRNICRMLRRSFNVVPLAEVMRLQRTRLPAPRRTVAITFDDCYRDNLFAARVLAEYGLPACFFVPTAFVGTDTVFDWDRGLVRMPNLTWDEIREMADMGHEIGSHTVSHRDMATMAVQEAQRELVDSKKILENQLGKPVRWFAYPFGGRNHFPLESVPLVTAAGYEACFSAHGGFIYPHLQQPIVPREPVPCFRSLLNLEVHLTGCLQWVYKVKRRVGLL
jgi:peptidoglycan/xylan/chitin deacetylase (PgdA/CDA1 family)